MPFFKSRARELAEEVDADLIPASPADRLAPLGYAGGMLALGALLVTAKPRIGHVPDPRQAGTAPGAGPLRKAARAGRDSVSVFAPTNVTDSIGRSLLLGGTALLVARLLDEMSAPRRLPKR